MMNLSLILLFQQHLLKQLTAWSLFSLLAGGVITLWAETGSVWQAFGGMNAVWALVNLVIASLGFYGVLKKMQRGIADESAERNRLLRVLKVNTVLDVGYVLVALGMIVWGRTPLLQGFGWGVLVQGGFLLIFDALHYRQGSRL